MSTTPVTVLAQLEKPLDRLNYFNGQRLDAADLRLEQQYHIRVRRWLNKSLYTTGIARGLEVVAQDPKKSMNVIVSPGLALDSEGREILLLDQVSISVVGTPSTIPGLVKGNYLTIQYNEQVTEEQQDGCTVQAGKKKGCGCGSGNGKSNLAWGDPALVRATPILGFTDYLPSDTSGKIVLAQIELDSSCNVVSAHPEVRRYVGAASAARVYQYALEGEREITSGDGVNSGTENYTVIRFHIRGREPNAVTVYLRADTFSTLHYTEMGDHTHTLSETGDVATSSPTYYPDATKPDKYKHQHDINPISTDNSSGTDGVHENHQLLVNWHVVGHTGRIEVFPHTGFFLDILPGLSDNTNTAKIAGGGHSHTTVATSTVKANPFSDDDHTHTVKMASMGNAGVTDPNFPNGPYSARKGAPLTYVNELQIIIDGVPQTDNILAQLNGSNPDFPQGTLLGDASSGHPLVQDGTGPIKLDFLPLASFLDGEHTIEIHSLLKKDMNGNRTIPTGGRILFNLYVE